MLDEIISTAPSLNRVKYLTADTAITDKLPVIDSHISFQPFVNFLKDKLSTTSGKRSDFYQYLIRKFEELPELLAHIQDVQKLQAHEELLELLTTAIFPVVCDTNTFTFSAPYQFSIFSYSDSFKTLFVDKEEKTLKLPSEISEEYLKKVQCSMVYDHILEKFYGVKLNETPELIYPVTDENTGMKKYYRMRYDRRFIDIKLKGKLPDIKDCAVCLNSFRILDLEHQLKSMPLELFEVEGFAVWVAEDVTTSQALEMIRKVLLSHGDCTPDTINALKEAVFVLAGITNLHIGLMPFVKINGKLILDENCTEHSLIGNHWVSGDPASEESFMHMTGFLNQMPQGVALTLINEELVQDMPVLAPMFERGIRSYISYPMLSNDGLLGLLEVGSSVPHQLDQKVMVAIEPSIPLLSVALLKTRESFNNTIERIVKEKFTALQSSVEWKFSEAAWKYLKSQSSGVKETSKIVFEEVYPLYGAIDIRNSSVERNTAIQKDLAAHVRLVDEILTKLQEIVSLTLLEGLQFKNNSFSSSFESIRLPEDELRFQEFLENEVHPVFKHMEKSNSKAKNLIDNYFKVQQDTNGALCVQRNNFEHTLATINKALISYLETHEEKLQKSYPHYFEKFRTDGVEYNIYIGQSMVPTIPFDILYLKNIRLWQLQSMAELAKISRDLLPELKIPLATTQLILVHSQPIDISFRKDERRFDVEGSYNIRYEVMKKRIDKATILGTQERLTQPDKIAIVYSNHKEVQEYEEYVRFLQGKNLLEPEVEFLDLEELQGLKGLKALRVTVV